MDVAKVSGATLDAVREVRTRQLPPEPFPQRAGEVKTNLGAPSS